jgi:predicted alpha/beta-hydrolase family hydrolase
MAMLFALAAYARLAQSGRLIGAQQMAAGVLLSILAAAIQASSSELIVFGVPFDHNGLFHIVQIAGLPLLASGLRAALDSPAGA